MPVATPESPASPTDRHAFAAARAICRRHAKSFYFASHLLPEPKREAAYAVYAFCRMIDDAVDAADPKTHAASRLATFADRLNEIYDGARGCRRRPGGLRPSRPSRPCTHSP